MLDNNLEHTPTILLLAISFFLMLILAPAFACTTEEPLGPQVGMSQTNVGKNSWTQNTSDDWQNPVDEETRGSVSTTNFAYALADASAGEIKLAVQKDSTSADDFSNTWHGYNLAWAQGAIYDTFTFSGVDPEKIIVQLAYDGFFNVGSGPDDDAYFTMAISSDSGKSISTTVKAGDDPNGVFSVPLGELYSSTDGNIYDLLFDVTVFAQGEAALAEFGNTFKIGFVAAVAEGDTSGGRVSGTSFAEQDVDVSSVPIPSTLFLLVSGILGIVGINRRKP